MPNLKRKRPGKLSGQRRRTMEPDEELHTYSHTNTASETHELKIIAINCGGHLYRDRKLVPEYLATTHPDILVVSETGLNDYYASQCTVYDTVTGYTWYHLTNEKIRKSRNRAISLLIRDKWLALIPKVDSNNDLCAYNFTIRLEKWNIVVLAVYGEPDAPTTYWEKMQDWIKTVSTPADRTIMIGDLNIAPNPQIDRYTPGITHHNTPSNRILQLMLDENHLEDIWRVTHGSQAQYTYKARREDENAPRPMSRVDLALTSTTLHDYITSCEILSGYGELTADHEPIEVIVRLPKPIPNMEAGSPPPETKMTEINVKALNDPAQREAYQQAFSDVALLALNVMDTQTAYSSLQDMILNTARSTLGTYERIINRQPKKHRAPDPIALTLGRCNAVLCSEPHLLREMSNGNTFRRTATIESLIRNTPPNFAIPDPPHTQQINEAVQWFHAVQRVATKIETYLQEKRKNDAKERKTKLIDSADLDDHHSLKRLSRKLKLLHTQSVRKVMTAVQNEVDPKQNKVPEFEDPSADGHRAAVRKFYEHQFEERTPLMRALHEPWYTPEFRKHRDEAARHYQGELTAPFTVETVREFARKLPANKAHGPDEIAGELVSALPENAITALTHLFNRFLHERRTPNEWRECTIFTLHKGGDVSKCSNYRPISLQSVIYKLFMNILTKRLTDWVEKEQLVSNAQGGFRRNRTCLEKVELLTRLAERAKRDGKQIHIVFADIKKAYDCVPFDKLVHALEMHNLDRRFVELIANIYSDNGARVITVHGKTDRFRNGRGVKQGCPMSPILFSLFLEPILDWLQRTKKEDSAVLAYADDMCLFSTTNRALQKMTRKLQLFLYHNGLELGVSQDKSKTVYMTDDPSDSQIYIQKTTTNRSDTDNKLYLRMTDELTALPRLTGTDSYKYLGVRWNVRLDWSKHLAFQRGKLWTMCNNLKRQHYTVLQTVKIFNAVIVPSVTFGWEVIRPSTREINEWNNIARQLINTTVGVYSKSRAHLNILPATSLGLGVLDFEELAMRARLRGVFFRGLNSPDTETSKLTADALFRNGDTTAIIHRDPLRALAISNTAHSIPPTDLRRIFDERDPAIQVLQKRHIYNVTHLIDANGEAIPDAQNDHELQLVLDRICVAGTRRVHAIVLHKIEHPSLHKPPDRTEPGKESAPLNIFTDASKRTDENKGPVGIGIHVEDQPELDHAEALEPDTDITVAEAIALASGISLHDPERPLTIYTDSKVNIDRLTHFEKHGCFPRTTPLRAIEPLRSVINIKNARKRRGKCTEIKHVLSHTLDNNLTPEKRSRRKQQMHDLYGGNATRIAKGNQRADALAKEGTKQQRRRCLTTHSTALPRFLLVDENDHLIENANKQLREGLTEYRIKEMSHEIHPPIKEGEPIRRPYEWLLDEDAHWAYSALLAKDTSKVADKLIRFVIRARRGLFADKQTRLARQDSEYWLRRYGGVQVDDDRCDRCGEVETRFHFCSCKAADNIRSNVTTRIIQLVNSHLQTEDHLSDIPCFWANEQHHERHPSALWQKIESRKVELSAMGIIPRSFIAYLESLKWLPHTNLRKIVAQIQILILHGHHSAWTERCKIFGEKHSKRVQLEKRTKKIQEREEARQEKRRRRTQEYRERAERAAERRSRQRPAKKARTTRQRPPPQEEPPP